MRDPELQRLGHLASGPFPDGLAGEEIDGVDVAYLDSTIHGIASHYPRNSRPVSRLHREMLVDALEELDRIYDALPTDEARAFFDADRAIIRYLLDHRPTA